MEAAMSDQQMADLARQLAKALNTWARSRHHDDLREVAQLHTELCRASRLEDEELAANEEVVSWPMSNA
jgi:hypothetical protein